MHKAVSFGRAAREKVERNYTVGIAAERFVDLYYSLLS